MFKSTSLLLLLCVSCFSHSFAQAQAYTVKESSPVVVNGLTMGFNIKSQEQKEVGSKGNFSRYSIQFYVTNTSSDPKIILYKDGWNTNGTANDQLAQFNCLNATGARLTSKSAIISAAPCTVMALVDDKDCNGKIIQNKRFVQIGSWIKPGQTITTSAIVIVPLNERPNVQVQYLANMLQPTASYYDNNMNTQPVQQQASPPPAPDRDRDANFSKIMNVSKGSYLNVQQGSLTCGNIDNSWWSAQWKLVPVMGGNYYIIKNKQTGNFISTEDPASMISDNYNSKASMWIMEPVSNSNLFYLRNANDGTYLNLKFGRIQTSTIGNDTGNAKWTLVQ
jgi:hypothetical protein